MWVSHANTILILLSFFNLTINYVGSRKHIWWAPTSNTFSRWHLKKNIVHSLTTIAFSIVENYENYVSTMLKRPIIIFDMSQELDT